MTSPSYLPVYELTRGETIESVHNGAIAAVDAGGNLIAAYGDPDSVTFLRSSAKPFQVMPFIEHGGQAFFGLSPREIAVMCASHSGTDEHVRVIAGIQARAGIAEADLLCGVHAPLHEATAEALRRRGEQPSPNRHNCSGKHTGMLAYAHMRAATGNGSEEAAYLDPSHPIQHEILENFAGFCELPVEAVALGTDGCSAPNFAVPLRNAALAFARLCDPENGRVAPAARAEACHTIIQAMMANPDMVGGPERFDTRLMEVTRGRLVVKGGAEGYQAIGLLPGTLYAGSPGIGITLKIGDGDARGKVRSAVMLETLRQLGALSEAELEALAEFGPEFPLYNWRRIRVGMGRPAFLLQGEAARALVEC